MEKNCQKLLNSLSKRRIKNIKRPKKKSPRDVTSPDLDFNFSPDLDFNVFFKQLWFKHLPNLIILEGIKFYIIQEGSCLCSILDKFQSLQKNFYIFIFDYSLTVCMTNSNLAGIKHLNESFEKNIDCWFYIHVNQERNRHQSLLFHQTGSHTFQIKFLHKHLFYKRVYTFLSILHHLSFVFFQNLRPNRDLWVLILVLQPEKRAYWSSQFRFFHSNPFPSTLLYQTTPSQSLHSLVLQFFPNYFQFPPNVQPKEPSRPRYPRFARTFPIFSPNPLLCCFLVPFLLCPPKIHFSGMV
ncbi:hypothetical protein BpHYR1_008602 [Brachionus plicatilis]|uniref:Uncharacterized protein n=1 Tax=Brachionus plicatilis TaxID=10195 RepID=A0A3M7T2V1_BRAPC|nr:hypothetical protein BpHYR1_008602 [Brachionus plicatilis]